jgi:hypothetical protein
LDVHFAAIEQKQKRGSQDLKIASLVASPADVPALELLLRSVSETDVLLGEQQTDGRKKNLGLGEVLLNLLSPVEDRTVARGAENLLVQAALTALALRPRLTELPKVKTR